VPRAARSCASPWRRSARPSAAGRSRSPRSRSGGGSAPRARRAFRLPGQQVGPDRTGHPARSEQSNAVTASR
jgi:hypothetical protein